MVYGVGRIMCSVYDVYGVYFTKTHAHTLTHLNALRVRVSVQVSGETMKDADMEEAVNKILFAFLLTKTAVVI